MVPLFRSPWRALLLIGLLLAAVSASGLACVTTMPGKNPQGRLAPLSLREKTLRDELAATVKLLAGEIGERNHAHPKAYARAADEISRRLRDTGLRITEQSYDVGGESSRNLIAELPGGAAKEQIVIVGAHYDSAEGTPGANDNGSGVAALITLARHFAKAHPARTVRFVAFADEEPPYFQTDRMGSLVYAKRCAERREDVVAMISLETMGSYSDAADSQHYPFPFSLFYPSKGNFLAFVGNLSSQTLTRRSVAAFRREQRLPSEGAAVPDLTPGVGWSDHWSFWQTHVAAVMVTDTAPFRYPHYHEPTDTPDKLDYDRLARAVVGLAAVIEQAAGSTAQPR